MVCNVTTFSYNRGPSGGALYLGNIGSLKDRCVSDTCDEKIPVDFFGFSIKSTDVAVIWPAYAFVAVAYFSFYGRLLSDGRFTQDGCKRDSAGGTTTTFRAPLVPVGCLRNNPGRPFG